MRALLTAAASLILLGCSSDPASDEPTEGVTIGTLQTQTLLLRMHAGPDGPRYSVSTRDGQLVEGNLDADALELRYRELGATIRSGTASPGPVLDASYVATETFEPR